MRIEYEPIFNFESCNICNYCEKCLASYPVYKLKWQNKNVKCVLNDNRSIVVYPKFSEPIRYAYRNIKRIEMRPWMKLVLILDEDKEIEFRGWRRKSAFYAIKNYFTRQLLV